MQVPPREEDNPLARRFVDGDEPDTIDLEDPGRFHVAPAEPEEPPTEDTLAAAQEPQTAELPVGHRLLISVDSRTGKLYLHPGPEAADTSIGDDLVQAPTELRRGDRIRIGEDEFEYLSSDP